MKDVVQMTWKLREKQPIILVLFIAFRLQTRESSKGDIWAKNNIFWCLVFVYFSCTCSLEVNASHLHGVCRVVWCDVCVVQQTLGAWLWLFSFATADEDKHRVERRKDVPEEGKKQQQNYVLWVDRLTSQLLLLTHSSMGLDSQSETMHRTLGSWECASNMQKKTKKKKQQKKKKPSPSPSLIKGIRFAASVYSAFPL